MSQQNRSITVSVATKEKIEEYYKNPLGRGVSQLFFDKYLKDTLSLNRAQEEITLLKKKVALDATHKKLLEIGSGFGSFVLNAVMNQGLMCYGAEPDPTCYHVSREILSQHGLSPELISNDCGEHLSYPDQSFDIVYSSNVLEHTQNPQQVFYEALRVLKPGGYLFFIIPNYASWWDGHYGVIWLPNMSRRLAKLYVKMLGRNPYYLDHLQLITLRQVEGIVGVVADQLDVLEWGWDIWEYRLTTLDFSGWADLYKLKKILNIFHTWKINRLIICLGKKFGWLTPIILVAKKKMD